MKPEIIRKKIDRILPTVQKPGRYIGGEFNQVVKDWTGTPLHVALAFPDIYDLGMSNLGIALLYDILNQQQDILAERVFLPWTDMQEQLRAINVPLYSLETQHALRDFDLLGISLPYETIYTNTLSLLDLAGIPLRSADRSTQDPVVIAGGHACLNPEPMAAFIDAFVIGEGEEVILEISRIVLDWKKNDQTRPDLLQALATIKGVYVPSLYDVHYHSDGTVAEAESIDPAAPATILKRIVATLPAPLTQFIVPLIDVTHNRIPIEIQRGCTRGCRFCHAGWVTRPVRERPVKEIVQAIDTALQQTGYEEIGLLSLSSSDYTHIVELIDKLGDKFRGRHINISLPSLRIESFSIELMEKLKRESNRGGFTLAPEAATERMRGIINKPVSSEQVLETAHQIYAHGWHTIKLYFMIGHPSETLEDVQAIAELCKAVLKEGRKVMGKRARVNASVGTFIPKPHTPFQWVPCDTQEAIRAKQDLLRRELRGKGLKFNWNAPEETMVEAFLSRGDRRISDIIEHAWRAGAHFDAWREHFNYAAWMDAFSALGIDPDFYTHRQRDADEILPWDVIDAGPNKIILQQDYLASLAGETRADCRDGCYACGVLTKFADLRRQTDPADWKCPPLPARKVETQVPGGKA